MTLIQPRRGTAAQWATENPVLAEGELGYETDTKREKRGDGSTTWNLLPYRDDQSISTANPSIARNALGVPSVIELETASATAEAAANSYTDAKLGVGLNPTTTADLLAWFAADNLSQGVFVSDTFARADSSTLGTSSGGQAWTVSSGVLGIASKVAKMLSGSSASVTAPPVRPGDYAITQKVKFAASGTSDVQIFLRYTDAANYIVANLTASAGTNRVQTIARVGGVNTQIELTNTTAWTAGSTVNITVECIGNQYYVYADRVRITPTPHTDAASNFLTVTRPGFGFGWGGTADTVSEVRAFFVTPIYMTTMADNAKVSAWPNLAAHNTDQSGAGTANRPVLRTAQQNSLPVIRFDGTQFLATQVPADSAEFTMVAALKVSSLAAANTILASASNGGAHWRINADGTQELLKTNTSSIGKSIDPVPANAAVVVALSYDSTGTYTFYLNGQPAGGGVVSSPPTFTAGQLFTLGSAPGATERFNGDMFEVVAYDRALFGRELQPIMASLAAKWGIGFKQRILSATHTPLSLNFRIKGSNIHPKMSDFSYGNAWVGVHGHWDWTWVKRNIDRAVSQGCNVIRLIGDVETVFTGVITQATYLNQLTQLVDYLASINVKYYHCASDPTHFGGADDDYVVAFVAAQAALLASKSNVIAFELMNEAFNGVTYRPEASIVSLTARLSAAVRAAAPHLPVTVSNASTGLSVTRMLSDGARLRAYAPHVDFFDFHVYPSTSTAVKPWHTAPYEVVCDRPLVFGEIGAGASLFPVPADRAATYESIRQLSINSPRVSGVIQWAAVNDNHGLYTETGDTLVTTVADAWALFED